uniref:Uncharacterized protein n=1 Tax=Rhizophora mucronata TaxID=61149 RepID=A0A2P2IU55_RHIMU
MALFPIHYYVFCCVFSLGILLCFVDMSVRSFLLIVGGRSS